MPRVCASSLIKNTQAAKTIFVRAFVRAQKRGSLNTGVLDFSQSLMLTGEAKPNVSAHGSRAKAQTPERQLMHFSAQLFHPSSSSSAASRSIPAHGSLLHGVSSSSPSALTHARHHGLAVCLLFQPGDCGLLQEAALSLSTAGSQELEGEEWGRRGRRCFLMASPWPGGCSQLWGCSPHSSTHALSQPLPAPHCASQPAFLLRLLLLFLPPIITIHCIRA